MINGMKPESEKDMVQIADLTVLGKSYFRIIWDQWRVEFLLSSEIITFAVILILARSGRKKNVFSGERI